MSLQHYESNGCDRLRNIGGRNNGILKIGLSRKHTHSLTRAGKGGEGTITPEAGLKPYGFMLFRIRYGISLSLFGLYGFSNIGLDRDILYCAGVSS